MHPDMWPHHEAAFWCPGCLCAGEITLLVWCLQYCTGTVTRSQGEGMRISARIAPGEMVKSAGMPHANIPCLLLWHCGAFQSLVCTMQMEV